MKIAVCIKQVPGRESELAVGPDGTWIAEVEGYDSSEADNYALEAALQLKEQGGGEVVALLLGPASASEVVKTALAKGADRAVHIQHEAPHTLDPLQIAASLAGVAREETFDLVLTGLQSDDQGHGQIGVLLAELLDVAHSTVVVDIQLDGDRLGFRRELEGGWSQQGELSLPAVLTVQSGLNKPRYATFKGIVAAKRKPVNTVDGDQAVPSDLHPSQRLQRLYVPTQDKHTEMLAGSPEDQAAALVDKLKNEARVL